MKNLQSMAGRCALLLALALATPARAQLSIKAQWKGRALEALDNLRALKAKLDEIPASEFHDEGAELIRWKMRLEAGFAMHAKEPAIVEPGKSGLEFKLALMGPSGKPPFLVADYFYDKQGNVQAVFIESLPPGWTIPFMNEGPQVDDICVVPAGTKIAIWLGRHDPFKTEILKLGR